MAILQYRDDHPRCPRNVGTLESPSHVGIGNTGGGPPIVEFYLRIQGDRVCNAVQDVRLREGHRRRLHAHRKTAEPPYGERLRIGEAELVQAIGGLPPEKTHCAAVAIAARHTQ